MLREWGPEDRTNTRIQLSGSKALDDGDSRNHGVSRIHVYIYTYFMYHVLHTICHIPYARYHMLYAACYVPYSLHVVSGGCGPNAGLQLLDGGIAVRLVADQGGRPWLGAEGCLISCPKGAYPQSQ